jgi:hypothetical protein
MDQEQIVALLRRTWKFQPDSRIDFKWLRNQAFRITEVAPDLTVRQRLIGYPGRHAGIVSTHEPDLTFDQARVYDAALTTIAERIQDAEGEGQESFLLIRDGEFPDIFHSLDLVPDNIAGNVKEGMLSVWHSIENIVSLSGYQTVKEQVAGQPSEIWVWPRGATRLPPRSA